MRKEEALKYYEDGFVAGVKAMIGLIKDYATDEKPPTMDEFYKMCQLINNENRLKIMALNAAAIKYQILKER